jgi:glutamate-1-semialdehyde 2,1-aminomutase
LPTESWPTRTPIEDVGGVGGTLAGNALSITAMRATLEHVLTDAAFDRMIAVADHFTAGVRDVITSRGLPWTITQLGARAEYRFCPAPPRTGGESEAAADPLLDEYLHLYTVNPGRAHDAVPQHGADVAGHHYR